MQAAFGVFHGRLVHIMRVALKVIRITAGVLLLLIGAIGGLIPIFQGWVFGLAGLALLSQDVPFIRRWYERAKRRFHELREKKKP